MSKVVELRPVAAGVKGALGALKAGSPFPRLGGLAVHQLPEGAVIRFKLQSSPLAGLILDVQLGAFMPLPELADTLRRAAARIEAHGQPDPDAQPAGPDSSPAA